MYLLFDIGGTNTRLAISEDGKSISDPIIFPTPQKFEEGMAAILQHAKLLQKDGKITEVAGGFAGVLDRETFTPIRAPHLPDWEGKSLARELEKIFGVAVHIENDSVFAALGEATHGAGAGFPIVAFLTISTGVGGARVVDGVVDKSVLGFEPGHQIIDIVNLRDLESFVSGTALKEQHHKIPAEISDQNIWEKWAEVLAIGVHNTIIHWSPHVVILGGSVVQNSPERVVLVAKHLEKILKIFPKAPTLLSATLGETSGLYGALVHIQKTHKKF